LADRELSLIWRLVAARALSSFGRSVISSTVLWELYERTGSKLVLAGVGAVQVLPVATLFTVTGKLIDRSDRRKLTTITSATIGAIGLALAAASLAGAPLAVYFTLLLLQGMVNSVHAPGAGSLIPLIISRGQLERANRLSASMGELSVIVAPAVSGLALAFVPAGYVYAAVAATAVASSLMFR